MACSGRDYHITERQGGGEHSPPPQHGRLAGLSGDQNPENCENELAKGERDRVHLEYLS
jgi:hypothetical protein